MASGISLFLHHALAFAQVQRKAPSYRSLVNLIPIPPADFTVCCLYQFDVIYLYKIPILQPVGFVVDINRDEQWA